MREKKVGVKLFLLLLCENFVDLGGHCVISGAQAHADFSNMAATASGCTVCEGCFHSTATTPFLAGSLSHYSSTETGFSTKTILPSARLFAPQVSIKNTGGQTQTMCRQSEENANIIYTNL